MDEVGRAARLPIRAPSAGASGAATRLLILGCVRIFQPVHGYFLRRELISWQVDEWASVHPGSIYNALRSLTRRELLEEVRTSSTGARPARTTYQLTAAGEQDFLALLRSALRSTEDPPAFLAAVNMASALPRAEVLDAIEDHTQSLEHALARAGVQITELLASPEIPDSSTEVVRIMAARTAGEVTWAKDYLERLCAGAYSFADESPDWYPTQAQVTEAIQAGVGYSGRPFRPLGEVE